MRTQSRDTSEESERILIQGHQAFPPAKRFALTRSITWLMMESNRATIPTALPEADRESWFVRHVYGPLFADALAASPHVLAPGPWDIQFTLTAVTSQLTRAHLPFALTGSLASCVYGFPRGIRDLDVLVEAACLPPAHEALAAGELASDFLVGCTPSGGGALLDRRTLVKVDLVTPPPPLDGSAWLARTRDLLLFEPDGRVPVLSPEDVVLSRLHWYVATGGTADDQWNDLMGVVKIQAPTLDQRYLSAQLAHGPLAAAFTQLCADTEWGGPDAATDECTGRVANRSPGD